MQNYTTLITAWNAGGVPSGASGTALNTGGTTASKIAAVNSWTVAGPTALAIVPSYKIYNAIVPSEFQALTAGNQQLVRDIIGQGTVDGSPGSNAATVLAQVFLAGTTTRTNLVALQNTFKTTLPWWQAVAGLAGIVTQTDCDAAGLS